MILITLFYQTWAGIRSRYVRGNDTRIKHLKQGTRGKTKLPSGPAIRALWYCLCVMASTKLRCMFRAVKAPYQLIVRLKGATVRVKPVYADEERGLIERTLARCEEFMAQVILKEQAGKDQLTQLAAHFQKRGWQVQKLAV